MRYRTFVSFTVLALLYACAGVPQETNTATYVTVEVPSTPTSDAVQGLDADYSEDYPTLYYRSPGVRRLNGTGSY